ncbi:MAG: response regulator [Leptospiraceae bacterium]|nr:response regulator [Leptospiraceae bacterium]
MVSEKKKTILLVEDQLIIAMSEKISLEKYGYEVITAPNGEEAVNIFYENDNIDLVLMDIDLGAGINGPEAAKTILGIRDIPVVFLSSHIEPEVVTQTERITSYGYVVKNSGITILDASIKMAFKLYEANKKVSESEKRYRGLLDNLEAGIVVHAPDTSIIINNPRASELLELNEDQMRGKLAIDPHWKFLWEDNTPLKLEEYPVNRILKGKRPIKDQTFGVYRPIAKDVVWLSVNGFPVLNQNGEIVEILISFTNITEKKIATDRIKYLLSEKELILKEVHHRIKNNISSTESLLNLQLDSTNNSETIHALQDAKSRVRSMRVLYDKLLISDDYDEISAKNYLESLIDAILDLFSGKMNITLEKSMADIIFTTKTLFPLGLILNELLTNIMKYAFKDRNTGLIKISLFKNGDSIQLLVQDDGCGLPKDFDLNKSNKFGLMLVTMLTKQLNGSFQMVSENGTKSTVTFRV